MTASQDRTAPDVDLAAIRERHQPHKFVVIGGVQEHCRFDRKPWPCDAANLLAEVRRLNAAGMAAVDEAERIAAERDRLAAHMTARHSPYDTEVYSRHHYDSDHHVEDPRCSDDCFERVTLCKACGSSQPCLEIRAFRAALDGAE